MKILVHYRGMSRKISPNREVKAIKALLSAEDIEMAKELTKERGIKLQAFYGQAIRDAIKGGANGTRNA